MTAHIGTDTVRIPIIEGEIVEDFPTTEIPLIRLRPAVPPSVRVAAQLPRPARVRRWQRFLRSQFVADLIARRYTLAGCALIVAVAAIVTIATRGLYWNGLEYVPIGGTQ